MPSDEGPAGDPAPPSRGHDGRGQSTVLGYASPSAAPAGRDVEVMAATAGVADLKFDATTWAQTFSPDGITIAGDPRATIMPQRLTSETDSCSTAIAIDALTARAASEPRVELRDTLGEGGMGVIRSARQVALGRDVAVKQLRPEMRGSSATTKLLHEAWVIGALEHPNVVPVYDIDLDRDGSPLVVLKRIEGVPWSSLVSDADTVRERFGAELLDWNLGILMQVLNAIRYAHRRGIIHRDLKPDNVMIGEFGEVYVLDWGLAASLRDEDAGRLPLAREITQLAGTPCYMAPEMLGDSDVPLSERTDVYLAGAVLYHVLTGSPPHLGETAPQILFSVVKSQPRLPADVPASLADICRTAMDADPDRRFASVEDMRGALQRYLRHRDSSRLADRAHARLAELELILEQDAPVATRDMASRERLYRLFGESRFGFREALRTWSDNAAARIGLERATRLMIEYELGQRAPRTAATLLAELPEPPADLRARIEDALADQELEDARVARLARLERKLDTSVGQGIRRLVALFMGVYWVLSPWLNVWLDPGDDRSAHLRSIAITAVVLVLCVGIGYWAVKNLAGSVVNLRYFVTLVVVYVLILIVQVGFLLADQPHATTLHVRIFGILCLLAMLAITMEHRFWPSALGYAAAFLAVAAAPDLIPHAQSLANLLVVINFVVIWRKPRRPDSRPDEANDRDRAAPPA